VLIFTLRRKTCKWSVLTFIQICPGVRSSALELMFPNHISFYIDQTVGHPEKDQRIYHLCAGLRVLVKECRNTSVEPERTWVLGHVFFVKVNY